MLDLGEEQLESVVLFFCLCCGLENFQDKKLWEKKAIESYSDTAAFSLLNAYKLISSSFYSSFQLYVFQYKSEVTKMCVPPKPL